MPIFVFENSSNTSHICTVRLINETKQTDMNNLNHRNSRLRPLVRGGFSLLFFFLCSTVFGQGFERYFEENAGANIATDLIQTRDDGFVFTGSKAEESFIIYKLDPYGEALWTVNIPNSPNIAARAVHEAANGDLIVAGYCDGCLGLGQSDPFVLRLDANGVEVWTQESLGSGNIEEINDLIELPNGNIALAGFKKIDGEESNFYYLLLNANGDFLTERTFELSELSEQANGITTTSDGNLVLVGNSTSQIHVLKISPTADSISTYSIGLAGTNAANDVIETIDEKLAIAGAANGNMLMLVIDQDGNIDATNNFGGAGIDIATSIDQLSNGNFIIGGTTQPAAAQAFPTLILTNIQGDEFFNEALSDPSEDLILGEGKKAVAKRDGGFAMVGTRNIDDNFNAQAFYFASVTATSEYLKNTIKGNIFLDANQTCVKDPAEFGLRGWGVKLSGDNADWFGTADENGDFEVFAPLGEYTLELLPPSEGSWTSCTNNYNINLSSEFEVLELDFAVREDEPCYDLQLDIANPYLTPCQNSIYNIRYGNDGSAVATGAFLEINLDESLTLVTADLPFIDLGDNSYRFTVGISGTIPVLGRDSFNIEVAVECGAIAGRAHRVIGQLFPTIPCGGVDPGWDDSSIQVSAVCDEVDGKIIFTNENTGTSETSNVLESIIIEDHVMFTVQPVDLGPGDKSTIEAPITGATYRIVTLQSENHPGDSRPTISVEGCSQDGNYTTGFATEWPEDDYDDSRAVNHEENIDINTQPDQFLRGYPKGFEEEHFVNSNTDLTYQINFRNTGPNSAIRVVVRDTISSLLDPATVVPGASSHDYSYEVYGNGILKFTFENINLPPGSGAETEGFVRYRVSQKPGNPAGTLIENSATTYLAYDPPQYSNQVFHTINDSLLVRVIPEPIAGLTGVEAYPNPFGEQTTISINGSLPIQNGIMRVYNGVGQLLNVKEFSGKQVILSRSEVAAGALFFQLEADGRLLATGQLIAQ